MEPTFKKSAKAKPVVYRPLPKKLEGIQTNETRSLTHTFQQRMPKGATPFPSPTVNVWDSSQDSTPTKTEALDQGNYKKTMAKIDVELKSRNRQKQVTPGKSRLLPGQYTTAPQSALSYDHREGQPYQEEIDSPVEYGSSTEIYPPVIPTNSNIPIGYANHGYDAMTSTHYQPGHPQAWQNLPDFHSQSYLTTGFHTQAPDHTNAAYLGPQAVHYAEHPHLTTSHGRENYAHDFPFSNMHPAIPTSVNSGLTFQVSNYETSVEAHTTHIPTLPNRGGSHGQYPPAPHDSTSLYYQTRY